MALSHDSVSMAVFCDFENVALGVRDAKYEKFDIKPVLERLLLKGSIVVKKAYCDWDRYKGFKAVMHEANFELIEIPHVRQSGKNSADIRLVVDALDLCYTKSHVDTFVIISGDSDFSPLVSKLRENAKHVIGVGVKQSTSDLLIANCDEFIFYDDLVREQQRSGRKESREAQQTQKRAPEEEAGRKQELEQRRGKAIDLAVETFEALLAERGDSGKIWASMLKEAIKRRNPGFTESYYGFRAFGNLLEEAQARGLLEFGRDEKSGAYVYRSATAPVSEFARTPPQAAPAPASGDDIVHPLQGDTKGDAAAAEGAAAGESRRKGRGGRRGGAKAAEAAKAEATKAESRKAEPPVLETPPVVARPEPVVAPEPALAEDKPAAPAKRSRARKRSEPAAQSSAAPAEAPASVEPPPAAVQPAAAPEKPEKAAKTAKTAKSAKSAKMTPARPRRPRKSETPGEGG